MISEQQDWLKTVVAGVEVRVSPAVTATRVLGWEGAVPLPLVKSLKPALMVSEDQGATYPLGASPG
ncbi:hypothetical protein ABZ467_28870 [Streptomyces sp. NPDC005727]|uniref:hypothetical protein n=1 Tax=Streptomyces sp. NPDC005727 TaxID=3157053 RepID=UPI0033E64048